MLSVLSNTAMTMADVPTELSCFTESGRLKVLKPIIEINKDTTLK